MPGNWVRNREPGRIPEPAGRPARGRRGAKRRRVRLNGVPPGPRIVPRRGNSSVGRAQPCQGWGREFESRFPLQFVSPVRSLRPGDLFRGLSGRVVMQRPAKPCTPVRFRPQPPNAPGRPRPGHPTARVAEPGRRSGLKIRRLRPCRFESGSGHQSTFSAVSATSRICRAGATGRRRSDPLGADGDAWRGASMHGRVAALPW